MEGSVLVTGGSGFIGRHLVSELQRQGFRVAPASGLRLPQADWSAALRGIDTVVHLAALAHERAQACERARDYETLRQVNALGTRALSRAAAAAGVRHFIFLSTIGVCGEQTFGAPFNERTPAAPRSLYAKSKLEAEELLAEVAEEDGLRFTILRPSLVYGPGAGGNLLRLLRWIERGWPLPLGAVANRRSLTGVRNLVSAIIAVAGRGAGNECFVVGDGEALSTAEIVRHLAAGMGRPARLVRFPRTLLQLLAGDLARRFLGSLEVDASKLAASTGWRPSVPAFQGLFETGARYRRG